MKIYVRVDYPSYQTQIVAMSVLSQKGKVVGAGYRQQGRWEFLWISVVLAGVQMIVSRVKVE